MKDYGWVAPVLTVIGFILGGIYFRKGQKRKRVEWWISLDQSLLADPNDRSFADQVSVNVGQKKLTQPRTVVIRTKNTGNVGFSTGKMEEPFCLRFDDDRRLELLRVERLQKGSDEPEILRKYEDVAFRHEVPLPKTVLNPGDTLICQMLVDGQAGGIFLKGAAEDLTLLKRSQGEMDGADSPAEKQVRWLRTVLVLVFAVATNYWILYK